MTHPFFSASKYPKHRKEAVTFHKLLTDSIREDKRIRLLYEQCSDNLPPLTPMLPPDLLWAEILDNLTSSGVLEALCKQIENGKYNQQLEDIIKEIREAKPIEIPIAEVVESDGMWNPGHTIKLTQESIQDFRNKSFIFVLSSGVLSGLLLGILQISFHLTILDTKNPAPLSFLYFFAVGFIFVALIAAAMAATKLLLLMKAFAIRSEIELLPIDRRWRFSLLIFLAGLFTPVIIFLIVLSPAPALFKVLGFLMSFGVILGVFIAGQVKKKFTFRAISLGVVPPGLIFFIIQWTLNAKGVVEGYTFSYAVEDFINGIQKVNPQMSQEMVLQYAHYLALIDTTLAGIIFFVAITVANFGVSQPESNYLFD